jgi:hypothetical protein
MSKLKSIGFVAVLGFAVLGACAAEEGESLEVNAGDLSYEIVDPVPESSRVGDDGVAPARDDRASKLNCVTVTWCNEPGPRGTVCKWHRNRPGCNDPEGSGAIFECARDARYVCGYVSDPFWID